MKATGPLRRTARGAFSLAKWLLHRLPLRPADRAALRRAAIAAFDTPLSQPTQSGAARSGGRAIGFVDAPILPSPPIAPLARAVAFYLPQFHPIPQNDAWWGKGFTEWSNVARALPQFPGHAQPRVPADLGFYDLRVDQVMRDQVELARAYGLSAFCFYYYWFGGRRLLHAPVERFLAEPSLDFSYCLCWANESWTRRWDGRDQDVLMAQAHSAEDDIAFIADVSRHLRDPRYLRVQGRPVLLVYRTSLMPDPSATAAGWRDYCRSHGIGEIHLVCVQAFDGDDPIGQGFDASVQFPPNMTDPGQASSTVRPFDPAYRGEILDWQKMAGQFVGRPLPTMDSYRGVNPAWDNEPRKPGAGRSFVGASPRRYESWLRWAARDTAERISEPDKRLVFVNAWNEWAEGAYLEPDTRLGHAWLAATRRALDADSVVDKRPCVVAHAYYPEFIDELLPLLGELKFELRLVITTTAEAAGEVRRKLDLHHAPADVWVNENRGRDVLPFLKACDQLLNEGVQIVLKVHGKKSPHLADGHRWRAEMLDQLLRPNRVAATLEAFVQHPDLGMVGPAGHWLSTAQHVGGNAENMDRLSARLGLQAAAPTSGFFAGTMFWLRLEALSSLLEATLEEAQFEAEAGAIDGTMAHACERLFASIVVNGGFRVALSNDPGASACPVPAEAYRYLPDAPK